MARALQNILLGFLSTAVFFAGFFVIGDVLIAAFAAFIVAVAQFVITRTTTLGSGLPILASLAVVIALTGLSLRGEDSFPELDPAQASIVQPNCHCTGNTSAPVRATPVPFREAPKTLAPTGGRV